MSKKTNRYIIIPILFFCIGGGTLFAFFGRNKSAVQQQQLSDRINLALRRTAHLLLKQAGDSTSTIAPVKQTAENTYSVELNHAFTYDSLPPFIQNSFDSYEISGNYDVVVWDCPHNEIILGYSALDFLKNKEVACVGRQQTMDCLSFSVTFTDPSVFGRNYWAFFALGMAAIGYFVYQYFQKRNIPPAIDASTHIENTENTDDTQLIHVGNAVFDLHNQTIFINNVEQKLTFQEAKLLQLFCTHKNELLDRDFILKSVWDDDGVLITRSVDVFVSRLRKILKPDETVKIATVHSRGYRFDVIEAV